MFLEKQEDQNNKAQLEKLLHSPEDIEYGWISDVQAFKKLFFLFNTPILESHTDTAAACMELLLLYLNLECDNGKNAFASKITVMATFG